MLGLLALRGGTLTPDDLEFFKKLLDQMLVEAQQNGDSTLEDLTESPSSYADPTDRASVESDRSFTTEFVKNAEKRSGLPV